MTSEPEQGTDPGAIRPVLNHRRAWARRWPLGRRTSIRSRLQMSHLITALVPLLVLGSVLLYTNTAAERRTVEGIQLSVARSVATDISENLLQAEFDLTAFGRRTSLTGPVDADVEAFMSRHAPDVLDLAVLDLRGNEVARRAGDRVFQGHELTNRNAEPFFAPARQGWPQRTITQSSRGRRVLQIAVPVRDGEARITGLAVAQFSTQRMQGRLSAVPGRAGRSAFLVDEAGTVLLGQPPATLAGSGAVETWLRSSSSSTTLTGLDEGQMIAARAQTQPNAWFVIVEQARDVAYQSQRRNTWLLTLMLGSTAGIVALWGIVMARAMTRPILQLRDGVRIVGSGQLGNTIVVEREDELGELALEFNRMSEQLAESHHAIEQRNVRLAESQRAIEQQNVRLREGLDLARLVQRDLLPHGLPSDAPIRACAASDAATEIGGDFYSYILLPDGRMRLTIGDASGKGVAAALVMALTSSLVEIHAREAEGPADLLRRLNAELCPRFSTNHMAVSLLVAEFDPHAQQISVANAGMISPLVAAPEQCNYITCFGPPLGIVEDIDYDETTVELRPDHVVVFISDGVVEARDVSGEMWGFERFETVACEALLGGPREIVDSVLSATKRHTQDTAPADDLTIIAATMLPAPKANEHDVAVRRVEGASSARERSAQTA